MVSSSGKHKCRYKTGGKSKAVESVLILPSFAGADSNAPGNTRYRFGTTEKKMFNTVPKLIACVRVQLYVFCV